MQAIRLSVIVPTHNRQELLLRLLKSLAEQGIGADQYEVIVVSDGSDDGTCDAVRTLAQHRHQIRLIEQANRGPAAARNAAAREARGLILAFTDDDCIASPDWLEKLVKPFACEKVVGVQGRTTTFTSEITPLTHQMLLEEKSHFVPTCNAAYRRNVFQQLGGFDERFPYPHNEDADLAWRFESAGRIEFAPDAVVVHPPRPESFSKKAAWVRYLESEFLLFYKNPAKYRTYRGSSPWRTIYWQVFVVGQAGKLKSSLKYILLRFRPAYFCVAVALVFVRWWNLIRYYARFRRAAIKWRQVFCTEVPSASGGLKATVGSL